MNKRSKRYQALSEKLDKEKKYSLSEAIGLIKEHGNTKFDGAVEIHFKTGIDVKQSNQHFRGNVNLPHGTGKTQKIVAITASPDKAKKAGAVKAGGEELIKDIASNQKLDFDILVAEPEFMPKMATIAKILGPRGLMPSPKNGTVSPDLEKAISELAKGKVSFKNDNSGNAHLTVGRVSFTPEQLQENITTAIDALKASRPSTTKGVFIKNITLSTTMGPGIKLEV